VPNKQGKGRGLNTYQVKSEGNILFVQMVYTIRLTNLIVEVLPIIG